jgi:hypothetical protein
MSGTQTIQPPQAYTHALLGAYEGDHLVPLGLGGAPYDPRN